MGLEKCPKCGKESLIKTRSIINLKTYEKQNINFSKGFTNPNPIIPRVSAT